MKNFKQEGEFYDYTPSGATVSSGDVVLMGTVVGVAVTDIADGATGAVQAYGVFSIAKEAPQVQAQGAKLYWDNTAKKLTTTVASNTLAGVVFNAALSADTTVNIKLAG